MILDVFIVLCLTALGAIIIARLIDNKTILIFPAFLFIMIGTQILIDGEFKYISEVGKEINTTEIVSGNTTTIETVEINAQSYTAISFLGKDASILFSAGCMGTGIILGLKAFYE